MKFPVHKAEFLWWICEEWKAV